MVTASRPISLATSSSCSESCASRACASRVRHSSSLIAGISLGTIDGTGLIDCHLYDQPGRLILHLVNLTSEATWRAPVDELIRVGPFKVKVRLPQGTARPSASLLVAGRQPRVNVDGGMASFDVESILDHEVAVIGD